jgi:hypothetical protein
MSKRAKPKLNLVKDSNDPEVCCADLSWLFGCFEYEAGLRSVSFERPMFDTGNTQTVHYTDNQGAPMVTKQPVRDPSCTTPWSDWHVNFGKSGAFTRARRIWNRFSRLRWSEQEMLRHYYESRQWAPPDARPTWGPKPLPLELVKALHRSYYGLEAA